MSEEPRTLDAQVTLSIAGRPLAIELNVPDAPVRLGALLPVFQSMADAVIGRVVEGVEESGRAISCRAGCGACCRQLVPIAEVEARQIRDLVERMPEPRRAAVRGRFAAARSQLEAAGMLDLLLTPERFPAEKGNSFGQDYFQQRIACPFLEDESCSIHPDRPIACREYLVTSPAAHCSEPAPETVEKVKLPRALWSCLLTPPLDPSATRIPWVPLVVAPEWAEAHPEEPPVRPATQWVGEAIGRLAGTPAPPRG
jgi:Fe-S-cluster containining protein